MEQTKTASNAGEAFTEVTALMARLRAPDGCPWDREQTFDSIKPHTLEEVYEVFDAIDRRAWPELQDELGDLLLQVLFYSQMAADENRFTIDDVVRGLTAKLVRRHPHIFGEVLAATAEDVKRTWEQVKRQERAQANEAIASFLDTVPRSTPALLEATKLGARAARVGFDWPDVRGLFDKVHEEINELQAELTSAPNAQSVEEEFGDLLFVLTSLARHIRIDPEQALRKANAKFRQRFGWMEEIAGDADKMASMTLAELEQLWQAAKRKERVNQTP